ncbi:MAG TPA: efflux transporter outer membrane subunit [Candidatus Binatia bacterium]|nr:efflux transporter outer membrane subunit [Candidatus Binatia bacterium]
MRLGTSRWLVPAMVLAALLAGCALGPDYQRPPVAEPPRFRGQATAEAASLADVPWWEVFQDTILKNLITEALGSNYDVKIAAARVQEARAQLGVARSEYFPAIGYDVAAERSRNSGALQGQPGGQSSPRNLYYGTLTASWELDIWGRIRRSNEAARASLLGTEEARRGVWLTLVSDLAQAYFELLALDVRLQIARDSTDAYQGTYNVFQDRLQVGAASKLETTRAEGALGAAQASIPELESDIVAKENQVSILLGRSPGPIPRGMPMYEQAVVPTVPAGLPAALLERRPDLRQAEQKLVGANANIGVAKAEFFPRLSLTALFGRASPEMSALTGGTATIWAVAGMLSGPIFEGGKNLSNYRVSKARWEQAKLQYEQAVLTALREVSDALTLLGKLTEAETGQERSVKALEQAVGYATDRYRHGFASYFEVLEAQQQLYPAQNTLAQIRRDRLLAHVQLYKALGGGWSLADAEWNDQTKGSGG